MRHIVSIFFVVMICLFANSMEALAKEYGTYEVQAGDSLWAISLKHNVKVKELKQINGLQSDLIHIGTVLQLPSKSNTDTYSRNTTNPHTYQVKRGDSLWKLARTYNTSISELKRVNNLHSDLILIGQVLEIPTLKQKSSLSIASRTQNAPSHNEKASLEYSDEEYEWLAKIIEAEAGNQPYLGKVAVANVVINRTNDDAFPESIEEVIFQKSNKVYQFSPVGNGRIYKVTPSEDSYKAALEVLEGTTTDPTEGALFFYNPQIAKDRWIRTREVIKDIGEHRFAL